MASLSSPSYAAIIDAGSSSSRLFIYEWQSDEALGEPLNLRTVFPSTPEEKKLSEASGGIQYKEKEMQAYLRPALLAGRDFLVSRGVSDVPIYLLATGGMRETVPVAGQAAILQAAHRVMRSVRDVFAVGTWSNNTRVIPGRVEGLYGWVALNYGRGVEEQISGLLELGGASMQIAYKVPEAQTTKEEICLLSGDHRVYSQTWDGFGADSTMRRMLAGLLENAGGPDGKGIIRNPCSPIGQVSSFPIAGSNRTTVGSGEFDTCLKLSTGLLKDGLQTRDAIPSYLDIASFSKHFYGVSNYCYNYQFFAKWGAYDARRAYDRKTFSEAVHQYCSSSWKDIQWADGDKDRLTMFTENRCFYTAWMLTLLHDDQYGFGLEMTQYDTWKGLFRFPTTTDLASRSSWTIGAAALIARHGELSFCPKDNSLLSKPIYNTTSMGSVASIGSSVAPVQSIVSSEETCALVSHPAGIVNPYTPAFTFVAYGLVLLLLGVVGYQRRQISRAARRAVYMEEVQKSYLA